MGSTLRRALPALPCSALLRFRTPGPHPPHATHCSPLSVCSTSQQKSAPQASIHPPAFVLSPSALRHKSPGSRQPSSDSGGQTSSGPVPVSGFRSPAVRAVSGCRVQAFLDSGAARPGRFPAMSRSPAAHIVLHIYFVVRFAWAIRTPPYSASLRRPPPSNSILCMYAPHHNPNPLRAPRPLHAQLHHTHTYERNCRRSVCSAVAVAMGAVCLAR